MNTSTPQAYSDTLYYDFASVHVGVAEYEDGPTGTTVFYFPTGAYGAVDVRGGAPGTINTDILRQGYEDLYIDAICFAGGSNYGVEAIAGVQAELLRTGKAGARIDRKVAIVPGAVLYDFRVRFNSVYPDRALGAAALAAAQTGHFPLGARGAGRSASQGGYFDEDEPSGQGGAFRQLGPTKVAVFTVINSAGSIVERDGNVVRCSHHPTSGFGRSIADHIRQSHRTRAATTSLVAPAENGVPSHNTTLTLVVTNQKLNYWALGRLAAQTHASLARAIQPFHSVVDGDVLFALSTAEVDNPSLPVMELALEASELAWDAVLRSVPPKVVAPIAGISGLVDLHRSQGDYEFRATAQAKVVANDGKLLIKSTGSEPIWGLDNIAFTELVEMQPGEYVVKNRWNDRLTLREDPASSQLVLTLSRGPRIITARKLPLQAADYLLP